MPGRIAGRTLLDPRSLGDALKMLRDEGPLTPMAGCTDLYVALNFATLKETRFLNLWRLEALRTIELRGNLLCVGAMATHTDLVRSPLVRRRIPMLAAASSEVGGAQIQNRGTLGGNIANASPAGDTLPVLAAADATVVLTSTAGTRRVAFSAFYTGYRATVRRPDELITSVEIPVLRGRQSFRKVGTRAAQAISKVVMAARFEPGRGSAPAVVRIAFGSVAPTVVRATRTEATLAAGHALDVALGVLAEEMTPIDDIRSTALYRRRVAANLLMQFWKGREV